MPNFQYHGRNRRGEAVTGRIEAATAESVANQLFNNGITPIDIRPAAAVRDVFGDLKNLIGRLNEGRVGLTDLIFFCRQMYTLLKAGVPIMQSLRGLRDSTQNPALAEVIGSIAEGLDSGMDLTSAVRRHPQIFSNLFASLVQVGETTGNLAEAFLQLAAYLEREKDTRERIKQALRYPSIVLFAITVALFIINIFVIPAFAKVYAGFHAKLPWPTRLLIATSHFMVHYWGLILVIVVAAALAVRSWLRTADGRYRWHRAKLKLPVVGRIVYSATLGRFARSLAVTLKAGVPLVQGMSVVARAVDNDFVGDRIAQMRDGVERGESITRCATATGLFPPLVLQMISVGEDSGALDQLLVEVADYYEREVDYDLRNLNTAIEPILISIIGVIVLILALGVFLPMWDLARAAQAH
ncbi:MAG: type II secretion system F family protein [Acidiferrobacterales bacterium]